MQDFFHQRYDDIFFKQSIVPGCESIYELNLLKVVGNLCFSTQRSIRNPDLIGSRNILSHYLRLMISICFLPYDASLKRSIPFRTPRATNLFAFFFPKKRSFELRSEHIVLVSFHVIFQVI